MEIKEKLMSVILGASTKHTQVSTELKSQVNPEDTYIIESPASHYRPQNEGKCVCVCVCAGMHVHMNTACICCNSCSVFFKQYFRKMAIQMY